MLSVQRRIVTDYVPSEVAMAGAAATLRTHSNAA
jgi:hypothetical protein